MVQRLVEDLEPESLAAAPPDSDAPTLSAQNPSPGATLVVRGTTIAFRVDDAGDGVALPSVIVIVNTGAGPVTAYSGGAFAGGYTGSVLAGGAGGYDFALTPPATLPELTAVSVRVQAVDLSPLTNALDQTYSFTTRDDTAPVVSLRTPAGGTLDVSTAASISFRVLDTGGSGVSQPSIGVTVTQGGTPSLAVVAGVIQAPWNGVGSGITPTGNGFDVVLVRTGGLTDEVSITVSVSVADAQANTRLDAWTFSTVTPVAPTTGPTEVSSDGGEIVSYDLGLTDGEYTVDVGTDPDTSAVRAYSGRSESATAALVRDGVITFVVPRLVPAEGYRARIRPVGGGAGSLTAVLFAARRRPLFSATHDLRRALPSRWRVGADEPRREVVT